MTYEPGDCKYCNVHGVKAPCWYTGSGWEWENYHEKDNTSDHSPYTSVDTDFILETSVDEDNTDRSDISDWYVRKKCKAPRALMESIDVDFVNEPRRYKMTKESKEKMKLLLPSKRFAS